MTQTPTSVTTDVLLRRALADRRMTARQLAELAELPYARVARTLRGERGNDLTVAELLAIATALGMDVTNLLPRTQDNNEGAA